MSKKNTTSLNAAAYFVHVANQADKHLTNKKLQKLLYYAQAWSLTLRDKPLFDDPIEAWIHGPVVPQVYHHYKKFGFGAIHSKNSRPSLNPDDKHLLEEVWRVYGKYDADYLEILSHNEDPWIHARGSIDEDKASDHVISHHSMRSFYTALMCRK